MNGRWLRCVLLFCALALLLSGCSGNEDDRITSADDINQKSFKLGVIVGSASNFMAEKEFPNADLQLFSTVLEAVAAVEADKIDGFVFDERMLGLYCETDDEITTIDETYTCTGAALGLSKDKTELRDDINEVLAELRADGTLEDAIDRWFLDGDTTMPELTAPENPTDTLTLLVDGINEPFNYLAEDGECTGFDVEITKRIAYALNMDWDCRIMNFDAMIPTVAASDENLIISFISETEERKKEIAFTDEYYTSVATVLVRKDRYVSAKPDFTISTASMRSRLSDATIGALSGTTTEKDLRSDYPDAEVLEYASVPDTMAALKAGKIDYAVVQEVQVKAYLNGEGGVRYCTNPVYSNDTHFVVAKGNTELRDDINRALAKLRREGIPDEAFDRWTSGNYNTSGIPECTSGEVLRVAVSSTAEPMRFVQNNKIIGFDCEIIQRVAYELGMRVEFQDMTFAAAIPSVVSGKSDIAVGIAYSDERAEELEYCDTYCVINIDMVEAVGAEEEEEDLWTTLVDNFRGTFITEGRWKLFLSGIGITILISVCSYILGTALGLVLCMMLNGHSKPLNRLAAIYAKVVTGIPILVWLMILYYMVFRGVDIPGIAVAIIGFGLETGATLSGIFKTGLDSVSVGQREAAMAMGFGPFKIFRRIIFPQAAHRVFDLYLGTFVSLAKGTSIVGYIAIMDLTKVSDIVRSRTYKAFFPLFATALIYFGITCAFIELLKFLQRRLNPRARQYLLKGVKLK